MGGEERVTHGSPHHFHWEWDGVVNTKMPKICACLTQVLRVGWEVSLSSSRPLYASEKVYAYHKIGICHTFWNYKNQA